VISVSAQRWQPRSISLADRRSADGRYFKQPKDELGYNNISSGSQVALNLDAGLSAQTSHAGDR
jgi:hypothetical protein